jgi:hypothetical protein
MDPKDQALALQLLVRWRRLFTLLAQLAPSDFDADCFAALTLETLALDGQTKTFLAHNQDDDDEQGGAA